MLRVRLFQDGADLGEMRAAYADGLVQGFTTNPTLMRKGGVTDYEAFAREALRSIPDLPISFEVFSDSFDEMEREARLIASWGENTYVKIPITNTRGESSTELIRRLAADGLNPRSTTCATGCDRPSTAVGWLRHLRQTLLSRGSTSADV